ncbi:PilW family protein [Cupriavidus pinatubonensis]|uniref:PilW family protein n=1 Tax=Cupriavidus pinatubonensis TaxID=248026 RepID=UPI003613FFDB
MNAKTMRPRRPSGMTLIEILVALVIAMFMLVGLLAAFLGMRQAHADQDRLAALQDNERMALTVLTDSVRAAGYFPDPLNGSALTALPFAEGEFGQLAAGQGVGGRSAASGVGESLTSRYMTASGDGIPNCLGQTNTSGAAQVHINTFAVSAEGELTCSLNGSAPVVLIGGITRFSVLYGTDGGDAGNVDRYLSADEVTRASLWPLVRTARIALTFANPNARQPGQPVSTNWEQTIGLLNRL